MDDLAVPTDIEALGSVFTLTLPETWRFVPGRDELEARIGAIGDDVLATVPESALGLEILRALADDEDRGRFDFCAYGPLPARAEGQDIIGAAVVIRYIGQIDLPPTTDDGTVSVTGVIFPDLGQVLRATIKRVVGPMSMPVTEVFYVVPVENSPLRFAEVVFSAVGPVEDAEATFDRMMSSGMILEPAS